MSENLIFFIAITIMVCFFVALFILSLIVSSKMKRKYLRGYESLAREMGFVFTPEHDTFTTQLTVLPLFKDSWPHVLGLLTGDIKEGRISLFGARLSSGKGHYTTCVVEDNNLDLPLCLIRPKGEGGFFGAPGKAYGQECSFDEDKDFSSYFEVHGKDQSAIRELLDASLLDWFILHRDERLHTITNSQMFAVYYNKRVQASVGRKLINVATELLGKWGYDEKMVREPRSKRKSVSKLRVMLRGKFPIVFLGLFFIAGLVLTAITTRRLVIAKRNEGWPTTTGTIISSKLESYEQSRSDHPSLSDIIYSPRVEYQYIVDSEAYTSSRVAAADYSSSDYGEMNAIIQRYPEGKRIAVHFDPKDPGYAVLEVGMTEGNYVNLVISFFALSIPGGILLIFWLVTRKDSQKEKYE